MPTIADLKQSQYLTQHDCEPPIRVTISGYYDATTELKSEHTKYALTFEEVDKPLVLNSTNGQIIAQIAKSENFDDWTGIVIVLYKDENVSFGGVLKGGIRVRAPRAQAAPAAPQRTAARPAPVRQAAPPPRAPAPNYDDGQDQPAGNAYETGGIPEPDLPF